jgi:hypothetical protein
MAIKRILGYQKFPGLAIGKEQFPKCDMIFIKK